jgi:hypothetical protein
MAMKRWTKPAVMVVALALAVAAVPGVYAMWGDDGGPEQAGANAALVERDGAAGRSVAAICVQGATDCNDTFSEDASGCAADEGDCPQVAPEPTPCNEGCSADCPPDSACIEPWLQQPPVCPDDVDPAVCEEARKVYAEDLQARAESMGCVVQESFPPVIRCFEPNCVDPGAPIDTVPAPAPAPVPDDRGLEPALGEPPVDLPLPVNPPPNATQPGEPPEESKPIYECAPPPGGECVPGPADDCGPIDCTSATDAPCMPPETCVPGPAVDCAPVDCTDQAATRCLPPDCAVSSDGSVSCPGSPPDCADGNAADVPCATEGSAGGGTASNPGTIDPAPPE